MKILFENWRRYLEEQADPQRAAEKIETEEPEDDDDGDYGTGIEDDGRGDEDELDEGCGENVAGISPRRDVATIAILDES